MFSQEWLSSKEYFGLARSDCYPNNTRLLARSNYCPKNTQFLAEVVEVKTILDL